MAAVTSDANAELLDDAGADPNIAGLDSVTPLEHARAKGYDEIVRILCA
jgi:hypothetical protein